MTQALTISSDPKTGGRRSQHRSGHSAVTPKMPPISAAIAASALTLNLTARLLPQPGHNSILIRKKKKKKKKQQNGGVSTCVVIRKGDYSQDTPLKFPSLPSNSKTMDIMLLGILSLKPIQNPVSKKGRDAFRCSIKNVCQPRIQQE